MKEIEVHDIQRFRAGRGPVLDVRSPVEFERGHIPGAVAFPVFSDTERDKLGKAYKHEGRAAAVKLGFDFAGPRIGEMVEKAGQIASDGAVRVHCWRGGMRSKSVAWCLESAGIEVVILDGGYKAYRKWARETCGSVSNIIMLRGLTGTGKTKILNEMAKLGEQVIDLEDLANHRGSNFGGIGLGEQPTTQQLGNNIAERIAAFDPEQPIWLEAESAQIGSCWLPEELFQLMKDAPAIEITRLAEERLDILMEVYGNEDPLMLAASTKRIAHRMGGERTKRALELINTGAIRDACEIILDYYDRSYASDGNRVGNPIGDKLEITGLDPREAASLIITEYRKSANLCVGRS